MGGPQGAVPPSALAHASTCELFYAVNDVVHSEGGVVGVVGGLALKGRCLPPHLCTLQRVKFLCFGAVSLRCAS